MDVDDAIADGEDLVIKKSRDMGASWIDLTDIEWRWMFKDLQSFLLGSRKEEFVDKRGDHKSLFAKLDFIHERLPKWLMPNHERRSMHLKNLDNGSTIDGESTNSDFARGDRRTAILLDEFASVENGPEILTATADATNCRLFNSTPKGANAFYDLAMDRNKRQLRMHWSQHPVKAKGLYSDADGKPRSPWYDAECLRRSHPMEIAQELDIDFLAADYVFFDASDLDRIQKENVRSPYVVGELDYDPLSAKPLGFLEQPGGRFKLWIHPDAAGQLPTDRNYVMGVDIAMGTGGDSASNSVISVADAKTSEKVLEFASNNTKPHELAYIAVAVARWFKGQDGCGAYMAWEDNGPGQIFNPVVIELGYRNFYYRTNEKSIRKKKTTVPGWWSSPATKLSLLGEYRRALANGPFINRCREAINECREYIFHSNNTVSHSRSVRSADPSNTGENHGDRVIADALVWKMLKEGPQKRQPEEPKRNNNCFAARRDMRQEQEKKCW